MTIKLVERNAHVCFKLITRTMITWKASRSEGKKQYGNQLFHLITLSALYSRDCVTAIRIDDRPVFFIAHPDVIYHAEGNKEKVIYTAEGDED